MTQAGGFVTDGRVNGSLNLSRALGDLEYKQTKELGPEEQAREGGAEAGAGNSAHVSAVLLQVLCRPAVRRPPAPPTLPHRWLRLCRRFAGKCCSLGTNSSFSLVMGSGTC